MKKRKVRTPEEQKVLMEFERAERLNRLADRLEKDNDRRDKGVIEFPLTKSDGEYHGIYRKPKK